MTFFIAGLFFLLLPGSPQMPKPLVGKGVVRFTEEDRLVLLERLGLHHYISGKSDGKGGMHIPLSLVWETVKHYRRWPHFVSTFCVFSTWSPLTTYTPAIMM